MLALSVVSLQYHWQRVGGMFKSTKAGQVSDRTLGAIEGMIHPSRFEAAFIQGQGTAEIHKFGDFIAGDRSNSVG